MADSWTTSGVLPQVALPAENEAAGLDGAMFLEHLQHALRTGTPLPFAEYMAWVKGKLAADNASLPSLGAYFERLRALLKETLPADLIPTIDNTINLGIASLTYVPPLPAWETAQQPLTELARAYLQALLEGDKEAASQLIFEAAEQGASPQDIYLYVFQSCQEQIGLLWQEGRLSVAQEHYCSAMTMLLMGQLYTRLVPPPAKPYTAVIACVSHELHEIGARTVATFLEMDGWKTVYLGAQTPTSGIVETVVKYNADLLGLSVTMADHLIDAGGVIKAVRASVVGPTIKILLGGYSVNQLPKVWAFNQADGYGSSAEQAVAVANHLMRERERLAP